MQAQHNPDELHLRDDHAPIAIITPHYDNHTPRLNNTKNKSVHTKTESTPRHQKPLNPTYYLLRDKARKEY
jgi:hypothetical protein